ncbi:hypothetical protein HY492_01980 [Candidatus Woesearchaeota archaeon]|nr:hypothetical protein [Candidatus Woesearchaeota archaeon]
MDITYLKQLEAEHVTQPKTRFPRGKEACGKKECEQHYERHFHATLDLLTHPEREGDRYWQLVRHTGGHYGACILRAANCPLEHGEPLAADLPQRFYAYLGDLQETRVLRQERPRDLTLQVQEVMLALSASLGQMLFEKYGPSFWGTYLRAEPSALVTRIRDLLPFPRQEPSPTPITRFFKRTPSP